MYHGAPSNGKSNSYKVGEGWEQIPSRAKGLTSGWKHPGER